MSEVSLAASTAQQRRELQPPSFRLNVIRIAAELLVVAAAGTLLFAWFSRLQSGESLSDIIASHGLIPAGVATQAAAFVIFGELVVAGVSLWLVCGTRRTRAAACWLGGIFAIFALYAGLLVLMPPEKPTSCGCGISGTGTANWPIIALRNFVAMLVLFIAVAGPTSQRASP